MAPTTSVLAELYQARHLGPCVADCVDCPACGSRVHANREGHVSPRCLCGAWLSAERALGCRAEALRALSREHVGQWQRARELGANESAQYHHGLAVGYYTAAWSVLGCPAPYEDFSDWARGVQ
jgi:hypothetical protein